MFVYLVIYGIPYEGDQVVGVFSDYVKAREFELSYDCSDIGGTEIRKVELDKVYDDVFQGIGEEV